MKYSILYCVYNNANQFSNSLWTATCQICGHPYEIVIVDNATPDDSIKQTWLKYRRSAASYFKMSYLKIFENEKRCTNITQGINLAAKFAQGDYIVIVADSNVLLSFNLLNKIDGLIDPDTLVLSTGPKNDVKISLDGRKSTEYNTGIDTTAAAAINERLLSEMGWPCDPLELKLIDKKHRFPPPHLARDCYIAAMPREKFLSYGGYDESKTTWGPYHEYFLDAMAKYMEKEKHLTGVRIVHQYHRVLKENPA